MSLSLALLLRHNRMMLLKGCRLWILCLAWLATASCLSADKLVNLIIAHTTDLHAQLEPVTDYEGTPNLGGIARLATMILQTRKEDPDLVLLDAGDTIQGSAYGYLTDGLVMMKVLNALKYDAWTLGNHEFDWGLDKLSACLKAAEMPVLGANIGQPSNAAWEGYSKIASHVILERKGLKIAVIGVTTPGIPYWTPASKLGKLSFMSAVPVVKQLLLQPDIKAAHIRILVAHQGLREKDDFANEINQLVVACPKIDIIIGGHSHRNMPDIRARDVLYTQAAYWGIRLGLIRISYDLDARKIVNKAALTPVIDEALEPDPEIQKLIAAEVSITNKILEKKIGETGYVFFPPAGKSGENPMHNLFGAAIADAVREAGDQVDGVMHGILDGKVGLAPGPITQADLFKLCPYENTIGVVSFTHDELRAVLEEGFESERMIWGFRAAINPKAKAGEKVVQILDAKGKPFAPGRKIRVAFNSYDLSSAGQRLNLLAKMAAIKGKKTDYSFQTREALRAYFEKYSPIKPELFGWVKIIEAAVPVKDPKPKRSLFGR